MLNPDLVFPTGSLRPLLEAAFTGERWQRLTPPHHSVNMTSGVAWDGNTERPIAFQRKHGHRRQSVPRTVLAAIRPVFEPARFRTHEFDGHSRESGRRGPENRPAAENVRRISAERFRTAWPA